MLERLVQHDDRVTVTNGGTRARRRVEVGGPLGGARTASRWRAASPPACVELVHGVALDVSHRADELSDEVTHYIAESLPELAGDDVQLADLRGSVSANIDAVFSVLRGEARAEELAPPPAAVAFARGLVRQGASLEAQLEAYHFGHECMWNWWLAEVRGRITDPDALLGVIHHLTQTLFEYVGLATQGVAEHYVAERERWLEGAHARRRETVQKILEGRARDIDAVSQHLAYELRRHHTAAVIWTEPLGDPDEVTARLEQAGTIVARALGGGRPLFVPAGHSTLWAWVQTAGAPDLGLVEPCLRGARCVQGVHVALGYPGRGLEGFRYGHEEALLAQRVALLRGAPPQVTLYPDVEIPSLCAGDLDRARRFVQRELGELSHDDERTRQLRETVAVLLEEGGSARRAAERLRTHKNTVFYRRARAETLLGRPIGSRRLPLMLALVLAETLSCSVAARR